VNVGVDIISSQNAVKIAHEYDEGVYAACGLHPNDVSDDFDFDLLKKIASDRKVVGIGETGLDYFRTEDEKKKIKQIDFFMKHIEMAKELKKPVIVHCRDAHDDATKLIAANASGISGVIHFFTGTLEQAKKYVDLGFYLSFAGVITFTRDYDEVVKWVPLDRVLVETDAPFVSPAPNRGKRNEPSYVKLTAEKLSEIKGITFEEMAVQTTKNARELFGI
jgi:TatD DNase family protein